MTEEIIQSESIPEEEVDNLGALAPSLNMNTTLTLEQKKIKATTVHKPKREYPKQEPEQSWLSKTIDKWLG